MIWVFFLLLNFILAYPIEIPITKSKKNTYYLNTCLGTPKQCFDLTITTEETNIMLYSNCPFTSEFSSTYHITSSDTQLFSCSDKLTLLNDTIIHNFQFRRFKTTHHQKNGNFGIGLARNTSDPNNILNQLLNNAPRKVFYFDAIRLVLGYGDFPPQYYSPNTNILNKKCKLILDHAFQDTGYYCILNSIFFISESETVFYSINKDVSLSFGLNGIQVPFEFYSVIKQKYFEKALKSYVCRQNENDEDFSYIICNTSFNETSLEYFTAVIGNWSFRIYLHDLFLTYNNEKIFLLMSQLNRSNWIFGYSFLKNYITVIDQEKMEIEFINSSILS